MSTVYPTSIQLAERQPTIALSIVLKAWKWAIVQLSVNYTCEMDGWVSCFNFLGNTVHELDMPWWPECWAEVEVLNTAGHTIWQVRQCTCPLWRFWCCRILLIDNRWRASVWRQYAETQTSFGALSVTT